MIVDTSVLVAIIKGEDDALQFAQALRASNRLFMSAAAYLECSIVLDRRTGPSVPLDELIMEFAISVEPFTPAQARLAREAHRRYGRGSGHPARLNFGDCFAYALAKERGLPLLFKGGDFARTDILPVR